MRREARICAVLTAAFLSGASTYAGSSRGTVGFQFLRTIVNPRPAAMAGAFVAIPGDLAGARFNPAGVAELPDRLVQASYANHVFDFHTGFLAYANRIGSLGQSQLSVAFISYGKFNETDLSGLPTGRTFSAGTIVVSETVAREVLPHLLAGISLKYLHSYIDTYSSQALLADLGLLLHTPVQDLDVAVAVQNVGQVFSPFVEQKDKLPVCYRIGWSKRLAHLPLLYGVEAFKYADDDWQFALGGEFTVTPQLLLRWGYTTLARQMKVDADADQFAGLSVGLGFKWRRYRFDYSLSSLGELGSVNRFALVAQF